MTYKVNKVNVYKKLLAQKIDRMEDIFLYNEYLGIILGTSLFWISFVILFIPFCIISLFQFKRYVKKIENDILKRPEYIKNWLHLKLVEKVEG